MAHYIRIGPDGTQYGIWNIKDEVAVRVGVADPERAPACFFRAPPGGTVWDAMKKDTPWFEPGGETPFIKLDLAPGQYYPRIARPIDQHPQESPGWSPTIHTDAPAVAIYRGQLNALTAQLDRICRTIHPSADTLSAYGHAIRNLLILACTEVEAHWRGVLLADGVVGDRFTTNHYVKLVAAMRLNEYAVSLPSFPWLDPIRPFEHWGTSGRPTEEIPWFADYHAVKHDRESEFRRATLANAFCAVSACAIMMAAEYGHDAL